MFFTLDKILIQNAWIRWHHTGTFGTRNTTSTLNFMDTKLSTMPCNTKCLFFNPYDSQEAVFARMISTTCDNGSYNNFVMYKKEPIIFRLSTI